MTRLVALVVDDEPSLLALLTELLETEGFSVISVADPRQLLDHSAMSEPSIILLDMMMPGISGLELAQHLRDGPFPTTPIIALSAAPALLVRAADSGYFRATVQKPFELDELVALVEQHTASDCRT